MAKIIIASYLVRYPVGGYQSWMLQWLLGFHRLGHEVYFVEKAGWENSCYDPVTGNSGNECAGGFRAVRHLLERFGLPGRLCFVDHHGIYHGLARPAVEEVFRTADLFVDHLQVCEWEEESRHTHLRVRVDGEPAYCQMRMEQRQAQGERLTEYDRYYSVGRNLGTPRSTAPDGGRYWRPIFDPVLPELFAQADPPPGAAWTTVMTWQAHAPMNYKGTVYGQKDVEFEHFIELPSKVTAPMELAIAGAETPRERLLNAGWRLRDSHAVTLTFDSWCDYIRNSLGEFSVAKSVFVRTNSGFFSDRSAAYLASGRPVVMQETGFSAHLPCGEGLFAVNDAAEAAAAIEEVTRHYLRHARAARAIAAEYLDARVVLGSLLRDAGLA